MSPNGGRGGQKDKQPQHQERREESARRATAASQLTLELGAAAGSSSTAPEVAPITDGRHSGSWDQGAPPMTSYVDHNADIPIPQVAPPDEHDMSAPPPPDDSGPAAATVDPVTGH